MLINVEKRSQRPHRNHAMKEGVASFCMGGLLHEVLVGHRSEQEGKDQNLYDTNTAKLFKVIYFVTLQNGFYAARLRWNPGFALKKASQATTKLRQSLTHPC